MASQEEQDLTGVIVSTRRVEHQNDNTLKAEIDRMHEEIFREDAQRLHTSALIRRSEIHVQPHHTLWDLYESFRDAYSEWEAFDADEARALDRKIQFATEVIKLATKELKSSKEARSVYADKEFLIFPATVHDFQQGNGLPKHKPFATEVSTIRPEGDPPNTSTSNNSNPETPTIVVPAQTDDTSSPH